MEDETIEAAVARLSRLPQLEYEKVRATEATAIGIRSSALDRAVKLAQAKPDDPHDDEPARESQASRLVKFVMERCDLFHDQNRDPYAHVSEGGRNMRIDGRAFKDWLSAAFFESDEKSPRDQSIREAITTLSGLARQRGEQHEVFIRVGMAGGAYYLDMCEPDTSRSIELIPGQWRIVDKPPVRFTRTEAMQSIPEPLPESQGDFSHFWSIANIPSDKQVILVAWLIDALRPDTPFPVLELVGEAGSAKSTTHAALKRIIDPNACDLRSPPKVTEDCFVTAGLNWIVGYENVSHLPAPLQDAMCVLATGGGFAKRKLYSDGEETVINVKRPVIINGISANITAHDLTDRAVSLELPVIQSRQASSGLMEAFERNRPAILSALLDYAAAALEELPHISVPEKERPRMLEFYSLGLALGAVLGLDFKSQFDATRADAVSRVIDGSPVAAALVEWFESVQSKTHEISVKALFNEVEAFRSMQGEAWPKSPKGFADALRRAAPSLRQMGIECRPTGRKIHGGVIEWRVSKV